eukprot:TRINITY_DN25460_c0_g1_i1.p1 TRINITY_DN25460_c0_g1~~TRINITY_DN25460_c0_g1_i1.p1  ORF type:complete len:960 (+),score=145.97 TRINITY_DN25460_c0_g1_i1:46-2880(+)
MTGIPLDPVVVEVDWFYWSIRNILFPVGVQVGLLILGPICRWFYLQFKRRRRDLRLEEKKISVSGHEGLYGYLEFAELVMGLISIGQFAHRTYTVDVHPGDAFFELFAVVFWIFAYLVELVRYEFSTFALFSPALVMSVACNYGYLTNSSDMWLAPIYLRAWMSYYHSRAVENRLPLAFFNHSELARKFVFIGVRFTSVLALLACTFFSLEVLGDIPALEEQKIVAMGGEISFAQMMYWTLTVMSTVGFGDFSPQTLQSRLFCMGAIITGVIYFGIEVDAIMDHQTLREKGLGAYHVRKSRPHILVVGGGVNNFNSVLAAFLNQVFSDKQVSEWPDVVLLAANPYDGAVKAYVDEIKGKHGPTFEGRIQYFVGSATSPEDLARVCADSAAKVFVLADMNSSDLEREDGHNILRAICIMATYPERVANLRLMLLRSESRHRAIASGLDSRCLVLANEIKVSFLGQCCRCHGFVTLISNMLRSDYLRPEELDPQQSKTTWLQEYVSGSSYCVHPFVPAERLRGSSWGVFARKVYEETRCIPIAMLNSAQAIELNPTSKVIENDVVFALAKHRWSLRPVSDVSIQIPDTRTVDGDLVRAASKFQGGNAPTRKIDCDSIRQWSSLPANSSERHIALIVVSDVVPWTEVAAFLRLLRPKQRVWEHRPVIVLANALPPSWISDKFTDVAFHKGSPFTDDDLLKTGIDEAAEVVVLHGGITQQDVDDCVTDYSVKDKLKDYRVVTLAGQLERICTLSPQLPTFMTYELWSNLTSKLLPPLREQSSQQEVVDLRHRSDWRMYLSPRFAAGQLFSPSIIGAILGRSYYVKATLSLLDAMVLPSEDANGSRIFLVPVPQELVGSTFAEVFLQWCDSVVPFGLYRSFHDTRDVGSLGYVAAAPDPSTRLSASDQIYVFARGDWAREKLNLPARPRWCNDINAPVAETKQETLRSM